MTETKVFNQNLDESKKTLLSELINDFDAIEGGSGKRNTIKIVKTDDFNLNIKSFKIPNLINQVVYNSIRKSKARRSFEYAHSLIDLSVGTPTPLAYFEQSDHGLLKNSYYLSEHLDYDISYRHLTNDFEYPNYEGILRLFTRFTYDLHEKQVHFLDHSPGNTLIKKKGNDYDFYLVDLNRMKFEVMDFHMRIKNFARLTIHQSMVEIMSDEYAKLIGRNYKDVFDLMWKETERFQQQFIRKKQIKKKLKFWE